MTDHYRDRKHLALADRHIVQAEAGIARQKQIIQELVRGGHNIDLAVSMINILASTRETFERHREIIPTRRKMPPR